MPEISRFLGIVIAMLYRDHDPPHFHVRYGEHEASIAVEPPALLAGRLPPRALALVIEWAAIHNAGTLASWARLPLASLGR